MCLLSIVEKRVKLPSFEDCNFLWDFLMYMIGTFGKIFRAAFGNGWGGGDAWARRFPDRLSLLVRYESSGRLITQHSAPGVGGRCGEGASTSAPANSHLIIANC